MSNQKYFLVIDDRAVKNIVSHMQEIWSSNSGPAKSYTFANGLPPFSYVRSCVALASLFAEMGTANSLHLLRRNTASRPIMKGKG